MTPNRLSRERHSRLFHGPGRRARLLMSAAALACAPSLALAQEASPPVSTPDGADGLTQDAAYFEADATTRQGDVISAEGIEDRVLARFRDRTLLARNVTYDLSSGIATASGQAELTDPDGTVVFASQLELDRDLKAGVAVDFATRLPGGASLMAATAVRRSANVSELNHVIFTPCPICDENGPKTPSISIQAEKVVQDEGLRAILYRNAVFRVGGVPVLYLPAFAHPDPTVERASGFLIPVINYDEGRGVSWEQPYLIVVSPSEDWLISPQINTDVAPLLNVQWRRRFADGVIEARGGYTYERNFGDFDLDGDGGAESNVRFGDRTNRSYILAHGKFDPVGAWRWGFTAERTSDKTLFDRYDVRDPYQDNGLYYGDRRRLITQLYAERQTDRSYLSIAAFDIQSLRLDPRVAATDYRDPDGYKVFEDDHTLPLVAPIIDARWEPEGPIFGGRLRLKGSAVALEREAYVGGPTLRPEIIPSVVTDLPGVDSRRITGQGEWRRTLISAGGVRYEPFIDGRLDVYSVADLPPMMGVSEDTLSRGRATAGLDVSYPLYRRLSATSDLVLEPQAQLSASTTSDLDPRIPNEDSQQVELDASSLFRIDRFPGFDLYEGGARFTAGARATLSWDAIRSASLFIGRSYRQDREDAFRTPIPDDPSRLYDPSGLAARTSDWVVQATFSPSDRIRGWAHATIDGSGEVRRAEAAVDGRWGRRNLVSASYIIDQSDPLSITDRPDPDNPGGPPLPSLNRNYEFLQLAGQQFIYGNWGVTVSGIADLQQDIVTRSEVGVLFDDDCFRFEIGFRRDNTRVRPSGPSEGVFVRLNLATFGGSSYGQSEWR